MLANERTTSLVKVRLESKVYDSEREPGSTVYDPDSKTTMQENEIRTRIYTVQYLILIQKMK